MDGVHCLDEERRAIGTLRLHHVGAKISTR